MKRTSLPKSGLFIFALFISILGFSIEREELPGVKSDNGDQKIYTTQRITGEVPLIDGLPNDAAWGQVEWGGDFIQWRPNEKEAPSQQTAFKILYDEKNLYVLIRAFDTEPEKIVRRMGRRDGFDGDWVEINIDSYNDKRTAFSFTASVSGVKGDELISDNGNNSDESWDPIWYLKTSIDQAGWIAEFRIPLSQLRFSPAENQVWGLQVQRRFFREEERSLWKFIPQNAGGWVHLFGELNGIQGIQPQKQKEIMPYTVAKMERYEGEDGNPFATGKDENLSIGLDGKIGLTNDITLDFSVNPDFGQVEADPSQLNLSAFQVFFEERRPFFIEGNNILDFRITQFRRDNLFYSRRIGGSPHYWPDVPDNAYVKQPGNTQIIGAAKVTGKNQHGFSFGVLESITAREFADIDTDGNRSTEQVEPLTNYFVARASQDINEGNTVVGGMLTSVYRDINAPDLDFLHDRALSGGLDLFHQWKDKKYFLRLNTAFSNVHGSEKSISDTQQSSERFFQRPNNNHRDLDTMRTSLSGSGGQFIIGKQSGKFNYEFGTTWGSPGFDLNDLGFLMSTDNILQWVWTQYQITKPFSIFRNLRLSLVEYSAWDFGRVNLENGFEFNSNMQFKNFWSFGSGLNYSTEAISNADLRGGPSITYPGSTNWYYFLESDNRKKLRITLNQWFRWGRENYSFNSGIFVGFRYRPLDALDISAYPSISTNRDEQQYVTTESFNDDPRYITGSIDQTTYRLNLRLNFNINPDLSIQYWGQPFVTQGEYTDFKKITDSNHKNYNSRFETFTASQISYNESNEQYFVDEDMNGITDYTIDNPNFNFLQYRSNMVVRWEYKPGSTLFVVWTQDRTDNRVFTTVDNSIAGISSDLFSVTPSNIFLLKYTYRFIL